VEQVTHTIHIRFLNPQKRHKTSGYETSERHNRQHDNSNNIYHK